MSTKYYSFLHNIPPAIQAALGIYSNTTYNYDDADYYDDLADQKQKISAMPNDKLKNKCTEPDANSEINEADVCKKKKQGEEKPVV